jgi:hypothetical protein
VLLPFVVANPTPQTPTPTPTSPPNSYQLIDAALARGEITRDQAALYKVYALFGSPQLPPQYRSSTLIPDEGTAALLYALKDWEQLSPATQRMIADFLTPRQVSRSTPPPLRQPISPRSTPTPMATSTRAALPTRAVAGPRAPVMFIENVGQFDAGARFQVRGGNATIYLADDALWFNVLERPKGSAGQRRHLVDPRNVKARRAETPRRGVNLKLSFPGANPHPTIEPLNRLQTRVSYFIGNDRSKWHTNVPVWGGVRYKDLYPGIDLEITSENGQLVQRLVARAGANLSAVRLRVEGADGLAVDTERLRMTTAVGLFTMPLFQTAAADAETLPRLQASPTLKGNEITAPFAASSLPSTSRLSNDSDLLYATPIGGGENDWAYRIAVDGSGAAYITGNSYSASFSSQGGLNSNAGDSDAFIAKLDANGTPIYAAFLGGTGYDAGSGIVVTADGVVYLTGNTSSTNFPITDGSAYHGITDAFVAKLDPAGNLTYSTLIGGGSVDWGNGIAMDGNGFVYVVGWTMSSDFYHTSGAPTLNGTTFVMKLDPANWRPPIYSTLLNVGGDAADSDIGYDIAVEGSGAALVAGALQPASRNDNDIFVVKLDASGSIKTYTRVLGGSRDDLGWGIATDGTGAAYVTGGTNSADFAAPYGGGTCYDAGPEGDSSRPCYDAFAIKLDAAGNPVYARFLGGNSDDYGYGIAVNATRGAYITGSMRSANFIAPVYGGSDIFVVKLDVAGNQTYARSLGGSSDDEGDGIALDLSGAAYLTGYTSSSDFLPPYGNDDVFVVKLAAGAPPTPTPTATATRTPTATPTVTPNATIFGISIVDCTLDHQWPTPQGHFVIWYTLTGPCAITGTAEVTFRTALGSGLEAGFTTFNNNLSYQLPAENQPYQVYVVNIRASGILPPLQIGRGSPGITLPPGVIFMDQHYSPDLGALGAHEYFHAVQWSYQQTCMSPMPSSILQWPRAWFNNEDVRWWMEATADWAQREAVTTDRSYIDPIGTYLGRPWQHMDTRPVRSTDNFAYSPLFPYYLVEQLGVGKDIIRTTWEKYRDKGNCGSLITVLQLWVLPENRKMEQIFPDYAEANYFLQYANENEFRTAPAPYGRGIDFRPVRDEQDLDAQHLTVSNSHEQYGRGPVQYLGTMYVELHNRFSVRNLGRTLRIRMDFLVFNPSTPPVVKIWTITQATPPRSSTTIIPPVRWVRKNPSNNSDEYVAEAIIPNFDNDSLQWVALEMVNPQTGGSGLRWSYQANVTAPTLTPTRTWTPTSTPARQK